MRVQPFHSFQTLISMAKANRLLTLIRDLSTGGVIGHLGNPVICGHGVPLFSAIDEESHIETEPTEPRCHPGSSLLSSSRPSIPRE